MTVSDLFRRTQVRSAAAFLVLFTLAVSTLFALLVVSLTEELEEGIRARVVRTKDALAAIDKRYGFDELVSVVTEEAESVRDTDSIFAVLGEDGQIHAGNVRSERPFEDWRVLERTKLPEIAAEGTRQDRFFAIWTPISKGLLLVGRSDREARQSKLILMKSLGWGLLATTIFGLGSGIYLARGAQRRIDDISATLSAVAAGQLDRRVPLKGSRHDLDEVSQRINAMLAQLQKLIQNVNQASTDIAHDLKKPMTRLRHQLESAKDEGLGDASLQEFLESAIEEVDSIVATFDALLNIGQLEAGDRRARFTDVDLKSVLQNVIDGYEAVIQDSGYHLAWQPDRVPTAVIRGDHELLVQLFANLIENVVRHCPVGTNMTVDIEKASKGYIASVADTGPGVPVDQRENVLRRFYRLERARSGAGHGLGLSLVAAIAELHGAEIKLEDNQPGLRVSLSFPQRSP